MTDLKDHPGRWIEGSPSETIHAFGMTKKNIDYLKDLIRQQDKRIEELNNVNTGLMRLAERSVAVATHHEKRIEELERDLHRLRRWCASRGICIRWDEVEAVDD